jgi:perosamine synthetase
MTPRFRPKIGLAEMLALINYNENSVMEFEEAFARHFQAEDAIAFSYGRSALWAFLNAVGINRSEIIMPAYSCSVVAYAITLSGNTPVFIDINLENYNINLNELEKSITPRTRAIIATHLFGYPLDMNKFNNIVREAEIKYKIKIWVIQDCAHSFGATWEDKLVSSFGDVALYGLNISKLLTSINGGMLTFNDPSLANKVRNWRDKNFKKAEKIKKYKRKLYLIAVFFAFSKWGYKITYFLQKKTRILKGFTDAYHLDGNISFPPDYLDLMMDVEASVGIQNLQKYEKNIEERIKKAKDYVKKSTQNPNWIFPPIIDGATYSHFVVRVPDKKLTMKEYEKKGIELGEVIQYVIPDLPAYINSSSHINAINSRIASKTCINLPL